MDNFLYFIATFAAGFAFGAGWLMYRTSELRKSFNDLQLEYNCSSDARFLARAEATMDENDELRRENQRLACELGEIRAKCETYEAAYVEIKSNNSKVFGMLAGGGKGSPVAAEEPETNRNSKGQMKSEDGIPKEEKQNIIYQMVLHGDEYADIQKTFPTLGASSIKQYFNEARARLNKQHWYTVSNGEREVNVPCIFVGVDDCWKFDQEYRRV